MNEIEFHFEELPLIVEGGFEAGLINGTATIGFHEEGEWSVREIALDGYRRIAPFAAYERKPLALCKDSHPWLYAAIVDRLESEPFKTRIEEDVALALEAEREDAA